MAHATLVFENPRTGRMREAPLGFSWTVCFFSFFPPLFRRDWKWFFIMLLAFSATSGVSTLIFMFIYNKLYIKDLIDDGFRGKSTTTGTFDSVSLEIGKQIPLLEKE